MCLHVLSRFIVTQKASGLWDAQHLHLLEQRLDLLAAEHVLFCLATYLG